jgi:hypothetical protein
MHGFSEREGRIIRIDGTRATLFGEFNLSGELIRLFDHFSGREKLLLKKKLRAWGIPRGGGEGRRLEGIWER